MLKKKYFITGLASMIIMASIAVMPMNVQAAENAKEYSSKEKISFEIRDSKDLAILSRELDRFIAQKPNSTEKEQEKHLISFMESGGLNNQVSPRSVGDYLPGVSNLTPPERKLAAKHPVQAIKVYDIGKQAESKTIEVYGRNGWLDNSDAFRHCLWNALMKQAIGVSAAEQWATAHEYNSRGTDRAMDLYNNRIGRSINVSGRSLSSIVSLVKYKVRYGSCRRVVNGALVPTDGTGM